MYDFLLKRKKHFRVYFQGFGKEKGIG
ncbi:hypothetical protein FB2170_05635 [Maribacter sp. HTCC2170]|nr:hypothetical protein FB2170_05635 [Maribacter sp. HTCC2170]